MYKFYDAFISYGRADSKEFCIKLYQTLLDQGLKVWFDQNDIPLGVDFQNQIDDGIAKSHNFLFVIAPHSVNSPYCRKEIELAIRLNKRIIPILQVEQINYETWKQRNPKGTDAEWQAYMEKGLHSSFSHLHPVIEKINWVYLRPGKDDFQTSFTGLMELIRRHEEYVQQHTYLLARSLDWEKHHKQNRYLLVGEDRTRAETWLKRRFETEQAPCYPSDLHCEYVSESIKNANNLMTHIFMSYSEQDKLFMMKLSRILMRESFTIWTNKTDIQTGKEFQEAINRGIEEADNVLYLISPDSLDSEYCQQEIDYALSLNKRIIPLLVKPTPLEQIPLKLRGLQFIDFTDHEDEKAYRNDTATLLKTLREDELYYAQHKLLLAKALRWEQQNRNASILLRGYNLRHAEGWLKVSKQRSLHPPLPLHIEFITESSNQPEETAVEVFVSYSRVDSDFARRLNDALQIQGKTTWFDQESIASGSDFQKEIYRGIENSNNFLFVISPSSINSPYCKDEVDYAMSLNKRIVTVLYRPIKTENLHPGLAAVQWIDFNQHNGDFFTNFSELVRTLDVDREYIRDHTKWSQRALEWDYKERSGDLLLRGTEFAVAQNWLQEAETEKKQPPPSELQREYITASQEAILAQERKEKRQENLLKALLVGVSGVAVVAIMGGIAAIVSQQQAAKNEVFALASTSNATFALGHEFKALIQALGSATKLENLLWGKDDQVRSRVINALQQPLYEIQEMKSLEGHQGPVNQAIFSPDGRFIATVSTDNSVNLWQPDGRLIRTLDKRKAAINDIVFSPDSTRLVTVSDDKTATIWDVETGQPLAVLRQPGRITTVAFSPNGQMIATGGTMPSAVRLGQNNSETPDSRTANSTDTQSPNSDTSKYFNVRLWRLDGSLIKTLSGHTQGITDLAFSPDNEYIAAASESGSEDHSVRVWKIRTGEMTVTLPHDDVVTSILFTPDGQAILTGSQDATAKLWRLDGTPLTLQGTTAPVKAIAISPDGEYLAVGGDDQKVTLWHRQNGRVSRIKILQGHTDSITSLQFNPESNRLASASADGTVKLWRASDGILVSTLTGHTGAVNQVSFSPDGRLIATAGSDRTVRLWQPERTLMASRTFANSSVGYVTLGQNFLLSAYPHPTESDYLPPNNLLWREDSMSPESFTGLTNSSANGTYWVSIHDKSRAIELMNSQGEKIATLVEKGGGSAEFSPDEKTVATSTEDGTLQLWSTQDGKLITTVGQVLRFKFSNQGRNLVTIDNDRRIRLWNSTGQAINTLVEVPQEVELERVKIIFSPDDQVVVTVVPGGAIALWDMNGNKVSTLDRTEAEVLVRFSANSQMLAIAHANTATYGPVDLWRIQPGTSSNSMNLQPASSPQAARVKRLMEVNERQGDEVLAIQFSPDSQLLTTIIGYQADYNFSSEASLNPNTPPGQIKLWQVDGTLTQTLDESISWYWYSQDFSDAPDESSSLSSAQPLFFSANTPFFITPGRNGVAKLWDFSGQTIKAWFNEEDQAYSSHIFTHSGEVDDRFMLFGNDLERRDIRFTPDGKWVVTISSDSVDLWGTDGTLRRNLMRGIPYSDRLISQFSPDRQILGLQYLNQLHLFQLDGTPIDTIYNESDIKDWTFSPDSRMVAAVGQDGVIKLWVGSSERRREQGITLNLPGKPNDDFTLFFSPNSKRLISIREDQSASSELDLFTRSTSTVVEVRDLEGMTDIDRLIQEGCNWVQDYLEARSQPIQQFPQEPSSTTSAESQPKTDLEQEVKEFCERRVSP